MGRYKEWLLEQEERGWYSAGKKYVCAECFDDEAICAFINGRAEAFECDYCGSTSSGAPIAAPIDSVVELIAEALLEEWNYVEDEAIMYDHEDDRYAGETWDTYDLVADYVLTNNDAIAKEIRQSLGDHLWCQRDFVSLPRDKALAYGWKTFVETVEHVNRYMFSAQPERHAGPVEVLNQDPPQPAVPADAGQVNSEAQGDRISAAPQSANESAAPDISDPLGAFGVPFQYHNLLAEYPPLAPDELPTDDEIGAGDMLDAIGRAVRAAGLIRTLPKGIEFVRARVHKPEVSLRTPSQLGPPPTKKAVFSNRMSPAGISMFYGASDSKTAIAETYSRKHARGKRVAVTVGTFVTLREMKVLDLAALQSVPSRFDTERRHMRPALKFLWSFVADLTKPIAKDGREHIEYVPTQIVTEYFRYTFRDTGGDRVYGILYPSSRRRSGTACVLFFGQEECGGGRAPRFGRRDQWLRLRRSSVETRLYG